MSCPTLGSRAATILGNGGREIGSHCRAITLLGVSGRAATTLGNGGRAIGSHCRAVTLLGCSGQAATTLGNGGRAIGSHFRAVTILWLLGSTFLCVEDVDKESLSENDCEDVPFHDARFKQGDICKIVHGNEICDVLRFMHKYE